MAILSVSGLNKSFGGVTAVNNLSFEVQPGTIFGIIGPNGAGKTSLFNVLTGFIKASGGSVHFHDQEVLGKKPHEIVELGMARSFQLVKPFFGMTALETLLLPSWSPRILRYGRDRDAVERAAEQRLEQIGLGAKGALRVDDLNQGELRLLDIARALSTEPDILFLDEPFSGLGHEHTARLSTILTQLRDRGVTIVIIEHRLRELMRLVDRVMVINFGSKLAEGNPATIVREPAVIEAYLGSKGKDFAVASN
jgi:branched-chain amino acid transport system ATP-binding protein